jgi:2-keto-3-deoxy-L-rhamnonate aldolase RhmA
LIALRVVPERLSLTVAPSSGSIANSPFDRSFRSMKPNRLKQLFKENKSACGTWVSLCSNLAAEAVGMVGFDWLLVDMEHGAGDYTTLVSQLQAIACAGESEPIVRVQWNDPVIVKRVLDAGARGVMIPGIKTVDEARRAIACTKYPPQGFRGIASVRAGKFGLDANYLKEANDNIAVFLQVETKESVQAIDAILDLPGIDVCFIGPNDLAADLGHTGDLGHADVVAAIEKVERAAKSRKIPLGTVSRSWDAAKALFDKGYQAVSVQSDVNLLIMAAKQAVENFRAHPAGRR